jgi:RinA family phage transcriptional activator
VNKSLFKYIEQELYDYEDTLKLIDHIKDDIRQDSGINYETEKTGPTYKIGHPTEDKAIKLMYNKQLNRAMQTICAIDKAIKKMDEEDLKLFNLKYIECIHFKRIMTVHMPMSEKSYYRRRNKIINLVAIEMGYVVENLTEM